MIDLSVRSQVPEIMEQLTDPAEYSACLADLAQANVLTRTHAPILSWLTRVSRRMNSFHVLDVACGHGDLLRAIHRWARRNGKTVILEGIDLNTESAASATPADMNVIWRSGDVFAYRPQPRPDFIVSSQFAHHLDDFQLVKFLHWMDENANLSWYILDLQRHVLAYYGFKLLSWVARWHPVMRHDGAVSVSRGFTRAELAAAASDLEVTIRWHLPFRFGLEGRYDLP